MRQKEIINNNEINLPMLFKFLLIEKSKIILILLISLSIGFGYNYLRPSHYEFSIELTENKKALKKYAFLNYILNLYDLKNINSLIYQNFRKSALNKNENILFLKNNLYVKKKIEQQSQIKRNQTLISLLPKVFIKSNKKKLAGNKYIITFNYNNLDEGKKIFNSFIFEIFLKVKNQTIDDLNENSYLLNKIENFHNQSPKAIKQINNFIEIINNDKINSWFLYNPSKIIVKDIKKLKNKKNLLISIFIGFIGVFIYLLVIFNKLKK